MLQEFLRLAVYVPVDEAGQGADLAAVSAAAVREILRTFRDFGFAGSVGTYQAVVEISSAVETFMPTADSAPTQRSPGYRDADAGPRCRADPGGKPLYTRPPQPSPLRP
jgi:hypothetical protein